MEIDKVTGRHAYALSVPLWTEEEGLSYLFVELKLIEREDGGYDIEIDDVIR